jgi:enediyne biosynthesis protein E4
MSVRTDGPTRWPSWASRAIALTLVVAAYGAARPPRASEAERAAAAARFALARASLDAGGIGASRAMRTRRVVNPSLEHIAGWISSVGAGAALGDVDGDGLPNDVCLVDPRSDDVRVMPVPDRQAAPDRYRPFVIDQRPPLIDRATTAPMGCLLADPNEDGRTDVIVYYWGRTPVAYLRVAQAERPAADDYHPVDLAPGGGRWYTNATTLADVDGDGHADLVVGNYFPDGARILHGQATVADSMQHSMSRAFNGGRNRVLLWRGAARAPRPDVRFRDLPDVFSEEVGRAWTLAVAAADLDGDLLPELYFANDFGPDRLLANRSAPGRPGFALAEGRRSLTTPRSKVLGRDSFKGMGADFGDLNADGRLDLFVSNIAATFALEESHFAFVNTGDRGALARGVAPFVDRSERLGLSRSSWAWDAKLVDLDNDGVPEVVQATGFVRGAVNRWPELHELATGNDELLRDPRLWPRFGADADLSGDARNPLWVRGANGAFVDVAPALGFGEDAVSRGVAVADVDGDSDLDLVVANQWGASSYWRNDCARPRRRCGGHLGLHLLLPLAPGDAPTTRARAGHPVALEGHVATGAEATVLLPDGRRLTAQVDGGNGHAGKRAPALHFGLGAAAESTRVRVQLRWRDPGGHAHAETRTFTPGWHTVVLAWPTSRER